MSKAPVSKEELPVLTPYPPQMEALRAPPAMPTPMPGAMLYDAAFEETTSVKRPEHALVGLFHASRMVKNLPLLLLVLGGAFTADSVSWGMLALTLVVVLVSSAFMTHVNILTDAELDKAKKPHLMAWMTADPRLTKWVMGLELAVALVGMAVLALWRWPVALGVAGFTAVTTLYSYNFLVPHKAVEWRLKATWWGHAVACLGAYFTLWAAGHFCAIDASPASFSGWWPLFIFISVSEYSLFLAESAIDADEERNFKLKTFATLLGRKGSSVLAVLVWLGATVGAVIFAWHSQHVLAMLLAFLPALVMRGVTAVALSLDHDRDELRYNLPDLVFWTSRLVTTAALAIFALTGVAR